MKQEIHFTVDPVTHKKSIDFTFDLDGLIAFRKNLAATAVRKTYWDWWNEQKKLHKYWAGYEDFVKADLPNRTGIMTEATAAMESWFEQGVLYDPPTLADLGPVFYDEPEELPKLLKTAQGKILANVLEYKHIPEYQRPQILMWTSARVYGRGEIKASFNWKDYRLGHDSVYDTEGMQPRERAHRVANIWYDYVCHRLYGFVSELCAQESDTWKQAQSLRDIEEFLDAEQRLKDLGLDLPNRLEYYARWLGYQNTEVSEMLQTMGVNKKPETVKKSYQRHRELMRVNQK